MKDKPSPGRVGLISLGCPKNRVDSEIILGELQQQGHRIVGNLEEADTEGAFVYSPEPDTPAEKIPGRVPRSLALCRQRSLLEAQRPTALSHRQRLVGCRRKVLVEGVCEESEHLLQGRHHGMAPEIDGRILINDGMARPGDFAEVQITEAYPDDLIGRIVGPQGSPEVRAAAVR